MEYSAASISSAYELNLFYFKIIENGMLKETQLQIGLIAITSVVIGLSAIIIGSYKDRKKQIRLSWINLIAIIILVIAFLTKAILFIPNFDSSNLLILSVVGLSIFFFIIYLNLRAIMLIKKDEELVRSADRIR